MGEGGFDDGDEEMGTSESAEEKWSASLVAEFDEHKCVFPHFVKAMVEANG